MKQMLRKLKSEKGFTLVELLAVIVILGIILAIAIPAIGSIMDKADEDTESNQVELILDAARLADVNKEDGLDFSTGVTVQTLIDEGYLEDNGEIDNYTERTITKTEDEGEGGNNSTYELGN